MHALQFNVSHLNSQISAIENNVEQLRTHYDEQIQRLSDKQSEINARMSEIEAKVNSASTTSPLSTASTYTVLLSTFFALHDCVSV